MSSSPPVTDSPTNAAGTATSAAPAPGLLSTQEDVLTACPDCDLILRVPVAVASSMVCARCGAVLRRRKADSIARATALTLTALVLFVLSNSFPFLAMERGGLIRETTLLTGIHELWQEGLEGLAALVLLTCVLVPLAQMLGLLYILMPLQGKTRPLPHAARIFRLVQEVAPWGMMEVFMIGVLVALVKLGHMATIVPGISVYSFGALIFTMAAAFASLDPPLLWDLLDVRR